MTRAQILLLSAVVVGACVLVPIIGARRWRTHDTAARATWWWLLLASVLSLVILATTLRGIRNAALAWATFPLYAFVGLRALLALHPHARVRTITWIAFAAYCVTWAVTGVPTEGFSSIAGPLLWVILCCVAGTVLILRMHVTRAPLHDFGVLVAIAVIVTYLPALALEPLSAMLHPTRPELVLRLWIGRQVLAVLGSFLFIWAYLARPAAR